ncbi:MAG: hypothetical protein CFE23_01745 [Flavobacterium sp. BFFFF1]|uniref:hypothetical protein n=1 Tax=unclassified Flavobacterium TaxID=196869 RepID=UPI000BC58D95|nr:MULTISPECIES: hypothetical protein [unclassified Flavobacterium]OYU82048.1 MAG: hypothetical protein CFE23_01745 [Flavobacterium sp. BFFFF1]
MKTVNFKGLFTAALFALAIHSATAQTTPQAASDNPGNYDQGFRLGFGLSGGYVFEDPFGAAVGADARLQYDLSKRNSITLTTGYTHLFLDGDRDDLGFIPVKAGFKGFIFGDSFYVQGEVGAAIPVTADYNETSLILAPSIGYATEHIDFSVRYEYYDKFRDVNNNKGVGQLALRIAYGFRL